MYQLCVLANHLFLYFSDSFETDVRVDIKMQVAMVMRLISVANYFICLAFIILFNLYDKFKGNLRSLSIHFRNSDCVYLTS